MPGRSTRDLFGAELRYWRERAGLSQARLGTVVSYSGDLISKVEKAERWPSSGLAEACDAALGTGGALGRMWPTVEAQRRQELEAAERRQAQADSPTVGGGPVGRVVLRADGEGHLWASLGWQLLDSGTLEATQDRQVGACLAPLSGVAYRQGHGSVPDRARAEGQAGVRAVVGREVVMATHEGSEHAGGAERREIGEATLEQLHGEVVRLSREFVTGAPFPLFRQMRGVRARIFAALERRLWPRDETELYFLLGCLSDLMAVAADDLGYPQAADELLHAGWAYAVAIDHRPLMARLRSVLAYTALWHDRPRQARDLAVSGLDYLADGQDAAQLHLIHARAAARLGDDTARGAIIAAHEARGREHHDELLEIGGEFGLSRASQHYLAGSTLMEIPDAAADAVVELEHATSLYAAGPELGEDHSYEYKALAHIDLAVAQLRAGALEAAVVALEPALSLPPAQRVAPLSARLSLVRAELAHSRYHGDASVSGLDERIEDFTCQSIVDDLSDLPGPR